MNNVPYFTQQPYGGQQQPSGYTYGVAKPQARNTQPLTQEQIDYLRNNHSQFTLAITEDDRLKCTCTHKEKNGASTLRILEDGYVECNICGARFKWFEGTAKDALNIVNACKDVLQTIKAIYVDAPEKIIEQFFVIISLLEKVPDLFEIGVNNFSRYDTGSPVNPINPASYGNSFNALYQTLSNPYAGYGQPMMYQQPTMAQPMAPQPIVPQAYGQPMMYQQPTMAQPMAPQPVGYENPMAYGAPTQAPAAGVIPATHVAPTTVDQQPEIVAQPNTQAVPDVQQQQVFNV